MGERGRSLSFKSRTGSLIEKILTIIRVVARNMKCLFRGVEMLDTSFNKNLLEQLREFSLGITSVIIKFRQLENESIWQDSFDFFQNEIPNTLSPRGSWFHTLGRDEEAWVELVESSKLRTESKCCRREWVRLLRIASVINPRWVVYGVISAIGVGRRSSDGEDFERKIGRSLHLLTEGRSRKIKGEK
ncbi:hypothetical protein Tco_1214123 [Tanacetum coccineum]